MLLKEVSLYDLNDNVFNRIGKQWMLIAAAKPDGSINAMTAAWGGLGFIWQKPVAYVFIRPQRCTKTYVEASPTFSLSFLDSRYRDALNFMGNVSGFDDPNKVTNSGLKVAAARDKTPYFSESEMVIICKRLYQQDLKASGFQENWPLKDHYNKAGNQNDLHTLYIAEINQVLISSCDIV